MKNKLKQFRVHAGMTQARVAKAVGVTQPNYHRWESGAAPVPQDKLAKLASILKATPDALMGRHAPIEAHLYDSSVSDDLSYYGEVAVHFCGGGPPLLLSISEDAFHKLHRDLQRDEAFVTVKSLANQTVAIRSKAIADLYFSSEAYDDYGPEHDTYTHRAHIQMPDPRDWEIVEALHSDVGLDEFDPADVKRVQERIMIADGRIKPEEIEKERQKNQRETDEIFELATKTTYQLSTGAQRSVFVDDHERLYDAFYELIEFGGGEPADDLIRLEAEGAHRIIFINKNALDYVAVPTHQYEAGKVDATATDLEALDATSRKASHWPQR